jgi:ATP-dependent DNA ligase
MFKSWLDPGVLPARARLRRSRADRNPQSAHLSPEQLNRLVNEDALPAPEYERPVFVAPGKQRPLDGIEGPLVGMEPQILSRTQDAEQAGPSAVSLDSRHDRRRPSPRRDDPLLPHPPRPPAGPAGTRATVGADWVYEPKLDGFRALVFCDATAVRILSRNARELTRWFPEVAERLGQLPRPCILDGELIALSSGRLDFDALSACLGGARPAGAELSLVCFDVIQAPDTDLRPLPFAERRRRLEALAAANPALLITPQSADPAIARRWRDDRDAVGLEGVVAKRRSLPYLGGRRCLTKLKHVDTADVVVGGILGSTRDPDRLLIGAYAADGTLRYLGVTAPLAGPARRQAGAVLAPRAGGWGFSGHPAPGRSRWESQRFDDWTAVQPLVVCEVPTDGSIAPGCATAAALSSIA